MEYHLKDMFDQMEKWRKKRSNKQEILYKNMEMNLK